MQEACRKLFEFVTSYCTALPKNATDFSAVDPSGKFPNHPLMQSLLGGNSVEEVGLERRK